MDDLPWRRTFSEIENKILLIALVHQKLYDSKDLSEIDLSDYICEISAMMRSFPGVGEKKTEFILSLEKTIVLIDIAILCGLIPDEMITNSLEYAFNDDGKATISICLSAMDGLITLAYEDSGGGFPDDYDPEKTPHIGFSIIREMNPRQLMGSSPQSRRVHFRAYSSYRRTRSIV